MSIVLWLHRESLGSAAAALSTAGCTASLWAAGCALSTAGCTASLWVGSCALSRTTRESGSATGLYPTADNSEVTTSSMHILSAEVAIGKGRRTNLILTDRLLSLSVTLMSLSLIPRTPLHLAHSRYLSLGNDFLGRLTA